MACLPCGRRCHSCSIPLTPLRLSLRSNFSSIFCELDVTLHHNSLMVEKTCTRWLHTSSSQAMLSTSTTTSGYCQLMVTPHGNAGVRGWMGSERQVTGGQAITGVTLHNQYLKLCYCCAACLVWVSSQVHPICLYCTKQLCQESAFRCILS